MTESLGFIITRHVTNEITNLYWIICISKIRQFYPENIIIVVDDNSNYNHIKNFQGNITKNCFFIQGEYNGGGELLPYYYYYKNHLFDKAVIIHDSVFINKYIDFSSTKDVKFIWHFEHFWDKDEDEKNLIGLLNYSDELVSYYSDKSLWKGCFGGMSVIDYSFVKVLAEKYNFFILLHHINNRDKRMCFERVYALVCSYEKKIQNENASLFNNIMTYTRDGYSFEEYMFEQMNNIDRGLELTKIWTGR